MTQGLTIPLPRALAPWAALFGEMPEAHVQLVSRLVSSLAPLIDKAEAEGARPRGEIDSFSGIGTRGDIERLLASEWLLRDLAPDEFLRRAADRELLTFEPVHRQAADSRTVLVVLDAGPAMLGRPRLVAFAALVCLANTARRRGAPLLWASNAVPARGWREAFGRKDVAALLDEVSATPLEIDDLQRIDAAAGHLARRPASKAGPRLSLWLVGPDGVLEAYAANRVAIAEHPRLDATGFAVAARVRVASVAGRAAEASFDLPGEAEATALLREPFRAVATPRRAIDPRQVRRQFAPTSLAFTRHAEHVVVAARAGLLIVPMGVPGAPVAFHLPLARHERILGLHVWGQGLTIALAMRYHDHARVWVRSWDFRAADKPGKLRFELKLPPDHPLVEDVFPRAALPFLGVPGRRSRFWAFAVDGSAHHVDADGVRPFSTLSRAGAVGIAPNAVIVAKADGRLAACARGDGATIARFDMPDLPLAEARAIEFHQVEGVDWLAVQAADGAWVLDDADRRQTFRLAASGGSERILGFVPHVASKRPAALTLAGDKRLRLRDERWFTIGTPTSMAHVMESEWDFAGADAFRVAVGRDHTTYVAAVICDDDGFVDGLCLGSLETIGKLNLVDEIIEWATCLRS